MPPDGGLFLLDWTGHKLRGMIGDSMNSLTVRNLSNVTGPEWIIIAIVCIVIGFIGAKDRLG
jgi:hypothetical protein